VGMIRERVAVYLVEAAESSDAENRRLERHARTIFESELEAWYRDPASARSAGRCPVSACARRHGSTDHRGGYFPAAITGP